MTKKEKLLELKGKIETLQNPAESFRNSLIAKEIEQITEKVSENQTLKNLQNLHDSFTSLKNEFNQSKVETTQSITATQTQLVERLNEQVSQIQESVQQVQTELSQNDAQLLQEFETRINQIPQTPDLTEEVKQLKEEFNQRLAALPKDDDSGLQADIENIKQQFQTFVTTDAEEDKVERETFDKALSKLRLDLMNRLSNLGGGQANRAIYFNGVDRLTRYTDINWKAGTNVTFTIANNDQTKKVDVTVSATGGGGGTTRMISPISTSQTAASAAGTDYVYLCSGTMTLTLPDATASNTNLYTIKNVGTGVVTINTTSAQTIDGALTQIMPIQFTSIDVISDTANWSIT